MSKFPPLPIPLGVAQFSLPEKVVGPDDDDGDKVEKNYAGPDDDGEDDDDEQ